MSDEPLVIDGSLGEGGGQILRTSLGLAAALWGRGQSPGRAMRIVNIRANRPKPGLRPQHLASVNAAAAVADAQVEGAAIDSQALTFTPRGPRSGQYRFEIGTAGSAMLVFQTVLPALLLADGDSEVIVTGGTHNPLAPCFEYVRDVVATLAEAANASVLLKLARAGFYPVGGGQVGCHVRGLGDRANLAGVQLISRGELRSVEGLSAVTESLPEHIVKRQAGRVRARLRGESIAGDVALARLSAASPGTFVFLRAVFSRSVAGFFALGRRGKPAERVADEAVDELIEFLAAEGAVDPRAADQLLTLLALGPARSALTTTRITQHLLTNAEVIRRVTGREVSVEGAPGEGGKVTLEATAG